MSLADAAPLLLCATASIRQLNHWMVADAIARGTDVPAPMERARFRPVGDIAAWFLDTDYDGGAFSARHAYRTGADGPCHHVRHALKAVTSDEV